MRIAACLLGAFVCSGVPTLGQSIETLAKGPLNNEAIVSMTEMGLADDVIVAKIQEAHSVDFSLEARDLVRLKEAGVKPEIMAAMITRAAATPNRDLTEGSIGIAPQNERPESGKPHANVETSLGLKTADPRNCLIGGHELGAPAADLWQAGRFEPGSPESVKIPDATTYRSLSVSGDPRGTKEYFAIRNGVLVAFVREYLPHYGRDALTALDERYGKSRRGNLGSVPDLTWTPVGKLSEAMSTSESWEDPTCGLVIQYVELVSKGKNPNFFEFSVTTYGETRRSIIWTKGSLPTLAGSGDAGSAAPTQAQSVTMDQNLLEVPAPAVIEIDASALRSSRPGTWNELPLMSRFRIDGAVLRSVEARLHTSSSTVRLDFHFYVRLRAGRDRNAGIDYELVDGGRVLGSENIARWNLDENEVTEIAGSLNITRKDFDALEKPVLRVRFSVKEPS
jgi:hypothetical protein